MIDKEHTIKLISMYCDKLIDMDEKRNGDGAGWLGGNGGLTKYDTETLINEVIWRIRNGMK